MLHEEGMDEIVHLPLFPVPIDQALTIYCLFVVNLCSTFTFEVSQLFFSFPSVLNLSLIQFCWLFVCVHEFGGRAQIDRDSLCCDYNTCKLPFV